MTRRGPGRSMTIMGLRSEHSAPGNRAFFNCLYCSKPDASAPGQNPVLGRTQHIPRDGPGASSLGAIHATSGLDLGIANDFTVGRIAIWLPIRRRLLRPRHSGLPSVFAALILLSLKVIFVRHGQLLSERILIHRTDFFSRLTTLDFFAALVFLVRARPQCLFCQLLAGLQRFCGF